MHVSRPPGVVVVVAVAVALAAAFVPLGRPAGSARPGAGPSTRRSAAVEAAPGAPAAGGGSLVVLRAPWGAGPGEVGRRVPAEGSPEAPMSFVVDQNGRVYVLDQVNRRVQVFEAGRAVGATPLEVDTYQDVALHPSGDLVLLDRLGRRAVDFVAEDGRTRRTVPLVGPHVREGGTVTALFQHGDGTWVEVEHRHLVRVALLDGSPDPDRPTAPGRLTPAGDVVWAARDSARGAVVAHQRAGEPQARLLARPHFARPVREIVALEADAAGRVILAAAVGRAPDEADVIVVLDPDGSETARIALPPRVLPDEQLRPIRLGGDGAVYQLRPEEAGVTLTRLVP
jgi:hypothetical protein